MRGRQRAWRWRKVQPRRRRQRLVQLLRWRHLPRVPPPLPTLPPSSRWSAAAAWRLPGSQQPLPHRRRRLAALRQLRRASSSRQRQLRRSSPAPCRLTSPRPPLPRQRRLPMPAQPRWGLALLGMAMARWLRRRRLYPSGRCVRLTSWRQRRPSETCRPRRRRYRRSTRCGMWRWTSMRSSYSARCVQPAG